MKKLLFIIFGVGIAVSARAQSTETDTLPKVAQALQEASKWLKEKNVQIRKTFDGSKDEAKPAAISWNSDYENSKFYSVMDLGIKISEFSFLDGKGPFKILFYPKVEWHRNTIDDDTKKKNNFTAGVNTEIYVKFGESWFARPFISGSFDYKSDQVKKLETTQAKAFFSFSGINDGEPGAQVKDKSLALKFRYYPYIGIESYKNIAVPHQSAQMWAARIFFEAYPISRGEHSYLQLTFEYTFRNIIDDNLYNAGDLRWATASANFFPDGKGKLGIGLDYSYGEDPSSNFVKTKLLSLGLKLKI